MLDIMVKDAVPIVKYAVAHMETMGQRIRQLRVAQGLTQPQLAELVGVTKSAVSQWEDDSTKNVKLEPFLRLCEVLRTDVKYLVYGPRRAPDDHHPAPDGPGSTGRLRRPILGQK